MIRALLLAAALLSATPATATRYLVEAFGSLQAQGGGNPIGGLPFATGNSVYSYFVIDFDKSSPTALAPVGGQGAITAYVGAVRDQQTVIGTAFGVASITPTAANFGALLVIDNGKVFSGNIPLRLDQVSITSNAGVANGGVVPHLVSSLALGPDTFISAFNFGRSAVLVDPNLPGLVTSTGVPQLEALWGQGFPHFWALRISRGQATTPAELQALPSATFNMANTFVRVTAIAVPEPASWAMLIAGFGLVGASLRRRRAAVA